jgi:pyrimidine deaminase RibD-like protein
MKIDQLESYNLADAVKFHDTLNPLLWDRRENLHPEIQEQLMAIAADFSKFLGVKDLDLKDITISGSNAAYSYTPHSDIDLHLIVDLSNVEHEDVYRELFDAKKAIYNSENYITIKGIPVEVYVQDATREHHSQGIYSVLNNDWIEIPRRIQADIDDISVRSKYNDLSKRIAKVVKSADLTRMNELAAKIKKMRQDGLSKQGEFSVENLVFKMLRNLGNIAQLQSARHTAKSKELSLKERESTPRTIYGFGRDYVDEVALTPGGISDHTKMFCEKEIEEDTTAKSQQEIIEDFIDFCSVQLDLSKEINLRIRRDPQWSVRNKTFGRYDDQTNELNVGIGGRHIMDVLRTVGHELVHQKQNELHPVPADAGADGSPYENEANARAGVLMRQYGKLHPELFSQGMDTQKMSESEQRVIAHGYAYNRRDQRESWTKEFASEAAAIEWARRRNATLLSVVPKQKLSENAAQNLPSVLYHATYKPRLKSIKLKGLGAGGKRNWEDSQRGVVYLTLDPNVAESYAETSDMVPDEWLDSIVILKIATAGLDPNKFHIDSNVQDNTGDTVEYHGIIPPSNISLYNQGVAEGLNEASGYIPTAAEADDPRFEMALTVDVRPGALGKAANSFLLNTDGQGHPQELRPDGLVQRMTEELALFKKKDIVETIDVDYLHANALREHLLSNPALYEDRADFQKMRDFLDAYKTPDPKVEKSYIYASIQSTPISKYVNTAYFNNHHKLVKIDSQYVYFNIDGFIKRFPESGNLSGDSMSQIYFFNSKSELAHFNTLLQLKFSDYKFTSKVLDHRGLAESSVQILTAKKSENKPPFSRDKLDSLLNDLCEKVIKGQEEAPDFYGMVAAAVIDPTGRLATGLNYLYGNERIHAERAAIDNYEKEYGDLPLDCVVVTTLSPCNQDTGDIKEITCTEVLNNKQVKLAYCGYRDPSQHRDNKNFKILITKNENLKQRCKELADTFLKADVDETMPGIGINVYENFADGRGPGKPGDSVRHGIPKHATTAELTKASHAKGRKGQLARWQLNMRNGHKK